jgi:hypothetical protein
VIFGEDCVNERNQGHVVYAKTLLADKLAHFVDLTSSDGNVASNVAAIEGSTRVQAPQPAATVTPAPRLTPSPLLTPAPRSTVPSYPAVSRVQAADGKCRAQMGEQYTPIVQVEFEGRAELEEDETFTVELPHCFDPEQVKREEIVVVYGHLDDAEWSELHEDDWSLRPALGDFPPCVCVRLNEEGIVAAYSRNNVPVPQRVVMLAFLPSKMIPLEEEVLRVHIVPALPDALESVMAQERGIA